MVCRSMWVVSFALSFAPLALHDGCPRNHPQESVRTALFVSNQSLAWLPCSAVVNYVQYASTVMPIYQDMVCRPVFGFLHVVVNRNKL